MSLSYSCYVISNKPHIFSAIVESLHPEPVSFFDGSGVNSFSQLVNRCVEFCPTETIILMSDKTRPTIHNVRKTLDLLNKGYAFVGLYRFGFFGFKKELFRRIGMMDERYQGGGYEDDDFYIRIKEANLALYLSHEVTYIKNSSSWTSDVCKQHFLEKWGNVKSTGKATRRLDEQENMYNLGPTVSTSFLGWKHSQLLPKKVKRYADLEIIKE